MLYERWRQIAEANRHRFALRDVTSGKAWTFSEVAALIEQEPGTKAKLIFPEGTGASFIFEVLRGWRANQVVCPLESGQSAPDLKSSLPAGIVHLKTTSASTGAPRLVGFR